jgi:hypothetical protein
MPARQQRDCAQQHIKTLIGMEPPHGQKPRRTIGGGQIGWRSVLKRIKTEASHWGAVLPTLPRKIDAFLTHDINQAAELKLEVSRLKSLHEKQTRVINVLILILIGLVLYSIL